MGPALKIKDQNLKLRAQPKIKVPELKLRTKT